jgi:hypothetical protein
MAHVIKDKYDYVDEEVTSSEVIALNFFYFVHRDELESWSEIVFSTLHQLSFRTKHGLCNLFAEDEDDNSMMEYIDALKYDMQIFGSQMGLYFENGLDVITMAVFNRIASAFRFLCARMGAISKLVATIDVFLAQYLEDQSTYLINDFQKLFSSYWIMDNEATNDANMTFLRYYREE